MSALEPVAQDGDTLIRELFRQRCDLWNAADKAPSDDAGGEMLDRACALEHKIELTPASGAAGIAIKLFLELHYGEDGDGAGLSNNPLIWCRHAGQAVIIRDLIRFAPELGPLCVDYLAALDAASTEAQP